jgi:NTP pyrophosphatase (non-canonical NTP hydrolase)
MTLNEWVKEVHEVAKEKGWYNQRRSPLEVHMLIVSELAEATEACRSFVDASSPKGWKDVHGKPEGEASELADALIRIMDYFGYQGWDLEEVVAAKTEYNKKRPFRHGGKKY